MIEINCALGEGGGQIIRTSLTLAALTNKPVKLFNIRKNRPNPGLAMQHLTGAKAVRSICRGELKGAELGSKELIFKPGKIIGGKYELNIGTAGSVTLVAQTILPILLKADKKSILRIKGGTHVFKSPTYDYFEHVFLRALTLMGAKISLRIIKTGYYPKGGGEIELIVEPSELNPISLFPKEEKIKAIIRLGSLPTHIGVREKKILVQEGMELEDIQLIQEKTLSPGNCITLISGLKGVSKLGEKGKRAEQVAEEAIHSIKEQLEFDVDYWLADQLLLYYALIAANQKSKWFATSNPLDCYGKGEYSLFKISNHLKTNIEIISKFLEIKIKLEENKVKLL